MSTISQTIIPIISKSLLVETACPTGLIIKATFVRAADGYYLDPADMLFKDFLSITNPYISLPETPPGGGDYSVTLDVTSWNDGNYTTTLVDASGASPVVLDTETLFVDGGVGAPVGSTKTRVDHDYTGPSAMCYRTSAGDPIDGAEIFVFDAGTYDGDAASMQAVAVSETNTLGEWKTPVFLAPGAYIVYFFKKDAYGPDTVNLTVS
jgi:hypothetical protein